MNCPNCNKTYDDYEPFCPRCGYDRRHGAARPSSESVSCIKWMDALAKDLERRAALAEKNAACPDAANILGDVARAVRTATARCSENESASIEKADRFRAGDNAPNAL